MRKISLFLFLCSFIFIGLMASNNIAGNHFRVATFNIRLQTPSDSDARAWDKRKIDVARIIKQYDFDIFGVQEVGNSKQEADLIALIPNYTYFGKGRDNQQGTEGEQIGIFFKTKRYSVKDKGSFFLSETPEIMSKGWDAACRRMCVWTKLYDKQTKATFIVFCTHFDHIGVKARAKSAKLIVSRVKAIVGNMPVLLVGDLNSTPDSREMYKTFTDNMDDSRIVSIIPVKGYLGTFNGYEISNDSISTFQLIDYIFCQKIKVKSYKVLRDKYSEGSYPSDHFPVMIECEMKNNP